MPDIRRGKIKERFTDFTGGQNSGDEADLIQPNQMSLIENGILEGANKIAQRKGLTDYFSVANAGISDGRVYGLGNLDYVGTNKMFMAVSDGTNQDILRINDADNGTTNVLVDTLTKEKDTELIEAKNVMLICNGGADNVFSIETDDTTHDLGTGGTNPVKAVTGTFHDGRAWLVDTNGILYWSNALPLLVASGAAEWSAINSFTPLTPCVKPLPFKNHEIIVYGQRSIEVINTVGLSTNWSGLIFNKNIGLAARRTAQNTGNDQVFLSHDGFRLLSRTQFDTVRSGIISDNIRDIIDSINWAQVGTAWAIVVDNKYIAGIPTGSKSYPNKTVMLDLKMFARTGKPVWTTVKDGNWAAYSAAVWIKSGVKTAVLGSWDSSGDADRWVASALTGTTDRGNAIIMTVMSREHDAKSNDSDKKWSHCYVNADAGSDDTDLTIQYEVDRGGFQNTDPVSLDLQGGAVIVSESTTVSTTLTIGGSDEAKDTFWIKDRGKTCRLAFIHNTSGASAKMHGYSLYSQERDVKGA